MQNAKDTFYMTLRSRLAVLNPARTVVVRGALRPGVLVDENELATASTTVDAFVVQWTGLVVDTHGPMPLAAMTCEVHYATDGNSGNGGMDRGRLLEEMDAELVQTMQPRSAIKMNYTVSPAAAMGTCVFWGDIAFGDAKTVAERLERTATVQVFAYQEAGEL